MSSSAVKLHLSRELPILSTCLHILTDGLHNSFNVPPRMPLLPCSLQSRPFSHLMPPSCGKARPIPSVFSVSEFLFLLLKSYTQPNARLAGCPNGLLDLHSSCIDMTGGEYAHDLSIAESFRGQYLCAPELLIARTRSVKPASRSCRSEGITSPCFPKMMLCASRTSFTMACLLCISKFLGHVRLLSSKIAT